ncbi:MAG: amidohydrolase family protein, partial [Gammaproteobacteria bacterium]|nr:amidohydrolase family protein [Gammaproteobacteria bacterium]
MRLIRSRILHWPTDQWHQPEYFEDGILLIEAGRVLDLGPAERFVTEGLDVTRCEHYPTRLVLPGFIDPHLHFPQVDVMASFGAQLLDWLNDYTFPAEARYSDPVFAAAAAESFLDLQLRHGTTSAFAFCTSHRHSVEALFCAAERRQLRMVAGKVLMDQNAPDAILDTAESGAQDSEDLIRTWHGRG